MHGVRILLPHSEVICDVPFPQVNLSAVSRPGLANLLLNQVATRLDLRGGRRPNSRGVCLILDNIVREASEDQRPVLDAQAEELCSLIADSLEDCGFVTTWAEERATVAGSSMPAPGFYLQALDKVLYRQAWVAHMLRELGVILDERRKRRAQGE